MARFHPAETGIKLFWSGFPTPSPDTIINGIMASWLVRFFLNMKAEVAIDETYRRGKSTLDISRTNLKRLPANTISKFYQVELNQILLQKNYLVELPEDFGLPLQTLSLLTLDYNNLTELPATFMMLGNLVFLNISNNPLETFPRSICSLRNLKTLWANGIQIKEVPDDIIMLTKLRFLGLRNNFLTTISKEICRLTKLRWLTFENNKIEVIPHELKNLNTLIHLNLNFNDISVLPDIWNHFTDLRYLFLKSNLLQVDSPTVSKLQRLPRMKKVYLTGNPRTNYNDFSESIVIFPSPNTNSEARSRSSFQSPLDRGQSEPSTSAHVSESTSPNSELQPESGSSSATTTNIAGNLLTVSKSTQFTSTVESATSTSEFAAAEEPEDAEYLDMNNGDENPNEIGRSQIGTDDEEMTISQNRSNANIYLEVESPREVNDDENADQGNNNGPDEEEIAEFFDEGALILQEQSWEFSEDTSDLDGNIPASEDDSDVEELPFDTTHATFGLWGILTS